MHYAIVFTVPAKKYFEIDAYMLEKAKEDDLVKVYLDLCSKEAEYVWYPAGGNPSNYPAEKDDFEGVFQLWKELGYPVEDVVEVWFEE